MEKKKITKEQIYTIDETFYGQFIEIRKELQQWYEIEKIEDLTQDQYEGFLYDVQKIADHTAYGRSMY